MLQLLSELELNSPALLCGFGGWADAASAASSALRYLLLKRQGHRLAEFDPDQVFLYTTTRPLTLIGNHGERRLQWPELTFTAIRVPEGPRDLVILSGPEPDLRWRECLDAISSFSVQIGVSRVITFGAFLAQVHYRGEPALMGISSDPEMNATLSSLGIEESSYQGPTSFVTAILREAADRGVPAASVWVAAPNYLSNTSNPKLAAALLKTAERLLGQDLWYQELETAGLEMEQRIEDALKARPDLANFLSGLSGESDPPSLETELEAAVEGAEPEALDADEEEPDLPTAEEVLRDLEEHLRRLKGDENEEKDQGQG